MEAMMLPLGVSTAARDRRFRRDEYRVLLALYAELDFLEPRVIKAGVIARSIGLARASVARSLGRLVHYGYLDRGPNDGRLRTYRLVNPRSPVT